MNIAGMRVAYRRMRLWTETGQAWFRFCLALMVLAGLGLARTAPAIPGLDAATLVLAGYVCYAGLWIQVVRRSLLPGRVRRMAAIVTDQFLFGVGL